MLKHKAILLISAFIVALLQCNAPPGPEISTYFKDWFVGPQNDTGPLKKISSTDLDSIIKSFRNNAKTGTFSETLTDTSGARYITGYKTPDEIEAQKLYPLIIYLHGGTGTELNTKGERAFEMLSPLADSMPLFLASPSANRDARWWSPSGLFRILQTLRFMTLHYPIDPQRVFLAGVSDGASGCWAAANTICAPFAGFIAISGYGGILPMTGMKIFPENIMQRPLYNVNAGQDHLYPVETVNRFLDYMKEKGVDVKRKVYMEEKHGFDYREQELATLCQILRTWSRPSVEASVWNFVPGYPNLPVNVIGWEYNGTSENSFIKGYAISDTFMITSEGLSSFILRLPSNGPKQFRLDQDAGKYKELNQNITLRLQELKESCFPLIKNLKLVKFNFDK